jgi:hypothetical protein
MITFQEAAEEVRVEKLRAGKTRRQSRFPAQRPNERLNTVAASAQVPQQTKTKPLKPGETEDESLSDPYADLGKRAEKLGIAIPGLNDAIAARAAAAAPKVVWDGGKRAAITPAYGKLEDIAKTLKEANPALSDAQAFEKAFLSNPELAKGDYADRMNWELSGCPGAAVAAA